MSEVNTPNSVDSGIPEINLTLEAANVVQAPIDTTLSISGMAADAKATGTAITDARNALQDEIDTTNQTISGMLNNLFPIGSVYISTSAAAPTFGGSGWAWQEIKMPATWGDLEDGFRNYAAVANGDATGTLHFWLRVAAE